MRLLGGGASPCRGSRRSAPLFSPDDPGTCWAEFFGACVRVMGRGHWATPTPSPAVRRRRCAVKRRSACIGCRNGRSPPCSARPARCRGRPRSGGAVSPTSNCLDGATAYRTGSTNRRYHARGRCRSRGALPARRVEPHSEAAVAGNRAIQRTRPTAPPRAGVRARSPQRVAGVRRPVPADPDMSFESLPSVSC